MTFEEVFSDYCEQAEWTPAVMNDWMLIITFDMPSGRQQTLYIVESRGLAMFAVNSALELGLTEQLPIGITVDLMTQNRSSVFGMWSIVEGRESRHYSLIYNIPIDALEYEHFKVIVETMLAQSDDFDGAISQLTGKPVTPDYTGEFTKGVIRGVGQKVGMVAAGTLLEMLLS